MLSKLPLGEEQRIAAALIAQKYGGLLAADTESIKRVAKCVVETERKGNKVAMVVPVMSDITDNLIDQALGIDSNLSKREIGMLITAGEWISMDLLAVAAHVEGNHAHPFTGQQASFFTGTRYDAVHIKAVRPNHVKNASSLGGITTAANFQDINTKGDATTLDRGSPDTFTVAFVVALGADVCEICTGVGGISTVGPRIVPSVRRTSSIDYEPILKMVSCDSKMPALCYVEYTQCFNMSLHVRSSFSRRPGILVVPDGIGPRTLPNLDWTRLR